MGHDIDNIPTFDPELMGSFQLTSFQCGQLSVDICVQADQDGHTLEKFDLSDFLNLFKLGIINFNTFYANSNISF